MSFKVKFNVDGSFIGNVRANENMEFNELINLFLKNNGFNKYHKSIFSFHSKKISRNLVKKLKELGIKANSVIEVKSQNLNTSNNEQIMKYYGNIYMIPYINQNFNNQNTNYINIIFIYHGSMVIVKGTDDSNFCDIAKIFCNKINATNSIPSFIINSTIIYLSDKRTLKELGIRNQSRIDAIFYSEIVGA